MSELRDLPNWLEPVLAVAYAPTSFREACRRAAEAGPMLARMRTMREALGPRPVPVERLVRDLAGAAGTSAEAVAGWAGLRLDRHLDPDSAVAWGRLASGLGMTWREARLHLRLSVLEHAGADPFLPVAARSSDPSDPLVDAEREADIQAARLADPVLDLLRDCEAAALDAFDDASA